MGRRSRRRQFSSDWPILNAGKRVDKSTFCYGPASLSPNGAGTIDLNRVTESDKVPMAVRAGAARSRPRDAFSPGRPSPVRGHALPSNRAVGLADTLRSRAAGGGTAAIFVGRTTTTGATNPSSPPLPCSAAAGTLRVDPSFAEGSPALDCGDEHKTPHPAAPAEPNIPAGPTPSPAPALARLPQRRSSACLGR